MKESKTPELINTAIAIPKYISERNYEWMTNNPKGFRTWFEKINEPFLFSSRTAFRQRLFEENKHIYSSVEEIPRELERSALQLCHSNFEVSQRYILFQNQRWR